MSDLSKPNYLQPIIDPEFGTTILRITDIEASVSAGPLAVIKPMYSTIPAWNADERYLILWQRGAGHKLFDGVTYEYIRDLDIDPSDLEHVIWHPTNPNVFFYTSNYSNGGLLHHDLIRYRVSADGNADHKEVVRSFDSKPLAAHVTIADTKGKGVTDLDSGADGKLEIELPPGRYRVTIEAAGYRKHTQTVRIKGNGVSVLNADMRAQ